MKRGPSRLLLVIVGAAVLGASTGAGSSARAQAIDCNRLAAQIAAAGRGGGGQYVAAAAKQRAELARTSAYANSLGCDRPQSFGDYVRELSRKLHRPPPVPISHRLVGLVASYPATAFGQAWLPLSNAKAKAELGWTPIPR